LEALRITGEENRTPSDFMNTQVYKQMSKAAKASNGTRPIFTQHNPKLPNNAKNSYTASDDVLLQYAAWLGRKYSCALLDSITSDYDRNVMEIHMLKQEKLRECVSHYVMMDGMRGLVLLFPRDQNNDV
jgi:hypothetical protein